MNERPAPAIRPRRMLFTLYGDYVYHRGGETWVGTLIRLMACVGISEPAVRSELMRMTRRGHLRVRRTGKYSFYSLTPEGQEILEQGARRIFRRPDGAWDGQWTVLVYSIPEERREIRDRLRRELAWLGFGALAPGAYVSPWPRQEEIQRLVRRYGIESEVQVVRGQNLGPGDDRSLVARCWSLEAVNASYREFLAFWRPRLEAFRAGKVEWDDEQCFVERYRLSHSYDRYPLVDPGLPPELYPPGWLGEEAAAVFLEYHERLQPAAMRFFDAVHVGWPGPVVAVT